MERKLSWTPPSKYTDGTPIPAEKTASIKIHVFKDGAETYVALPGVTEWPIEVGIPGTTSVWELSAELDGVAGPKCPPYSYTEPFLRPAPPTMVGVS
jgi:hypothetical protein